MKGSMVFKMEVDPFKLTILQIGGEYFGMDEENNQLYWLGEHGYTTDIPEELRDEYEFVKAKFNFICDLAGEKKLF